VVNSFPVVGPSECVLHGWVLRRDLTGLLRDLEPLIVNCKRADRAGEWAAKAEFLILAGVFAPDTKCMHSYQHFSVLSRLGSFCSTIFCVF